MKEIKLTKGYVALVDDDDYEWLSKFKWCVNLSYSPRAYRPVNTVDGKGVVYMHREICRARSFELVDHKDGDALNNQKGNLRIATSQQNVWNQKMRKNRYGYKGVSFREDLKEKPWTAGITYNKKSYKLGYFKTKEEAARAYNKAALEFFGEFARLNEI